VTGRVGGGGADKGGGEGGKDERCWWGGADVAGPGIPGGGLRRCVLGHSHPLTLQPCHHPAREVWDVAVSREVMVW
jgi:hypothetical protein